jgi:broad specificity phosphatase PhoE
MEQQWPKTLWLVRHGQSAGNVAGAAAEAASLPSIDIVTRDVDTPLSTLGEQQSRALGRWFRDLPREEQPNVLLCSPYLRARTTALLILETARLEKDLALFKADERLREKEFGILDRLTKVGIIERYPQLAEQRGHVGKFYFRPPGGESWCDVILRLRSILDTIVREQSRERVLIVSHEVVVNCMRYLLEHMDERQVLAIDRADDVPNCSVTSYEFDPAQGRHGKLVPRLVNFVAPLEVTGTPVTAEPDRPVAAKS